MNWPVLPRPTLPRRPARMLWAVVIGGAFLFGLAGCGGANKPSAPSGGANQPAKEPIEQPVAQAPNSGEDAAPAPGPAPAQPPVAKRREPKPNPARATRSPALDPSVNPDDVFAVVPGKRTVEIVQAEGKPISANNFTAVSPPQGTDSTRLTILSIPGDDSTPSPEQKSPKPPERTETNAPERSETKAPERSDARSRPRGDAKSAERTGRRRADGTGARLAERGGRKATKAAPKVSEPDQSGETKTLPSGFVALPRAGLSRVGRPLRIRCQRDGSVMALVTGGAVIVGHDGGPPESSPQITVVLDSFYMDVTEVTLGQYERFRNAVNEERGRKAVVQPKNAGAAGNLPALGLTLQQAQFYARWAGKELPTEAEWERAARGETGFDHPWGNGRAIWSRARTRDAIDGVKSFPTDLSPFGIYDLAGNAREWCLDRYSPTAFADAARASKGEGQLRNWKGPRKAEPDNFHVVKGNGPHWDAWHRAGMNASERNPHVGFRCVLRLSEKNE